MTHEQIKVIGELRGSGHAVIVWTPDELEGIDPTDVEDRSIELGHEVIADLQHFAKFTATVTQPPSPDEG